MLLSLKSRLFHPCHMMSNECAILETLLFYLSIDNRYLFLPFIKPLPQFADAEEDEIIPSSNIEIKFTDKVMTSSYGSDVSDEEDIDDDFYEPDFKPVKTSGNLKSVKSVLTPKLIGIYRPLTLTDKFQQFSVIDS